MRSGLAVRTRHIGGPRCGGPHGGVWPGSRVTAELMSGPPRTRQVAPSGRFPLATLGGDEDSRAAGAPSRGSSVGGRPAASARSGAIVADQRQASVPSGASLTVSATWAEADPRQASASVALTPVISATWAGAPCVRGCGLGDRGRPASRASVNGTPESTEAGSAGSPNWPDETA